MLLTTLIALTTSFAPARACPLAAHTVLPEFTGAWQLLRISGLDQPHPDSAQTTATFSEDLQGCLVREQIRAESGRPPYEALALWGVNGPDGQIQRIFTHAQHGRLGVYQGPRTGTTISLRQLPAAGQPTAEIVENVVQIEDRDYFTLVSRLSSDGGGTWRVLSRWEYRQTGAVH